MESARRSSEGRVDRLTARTGAPAVRMTRADAAIDRLSPGLTTREAAAPHMRAGMRGEPAETMPYRDPIAALEIKLRQLRDARRALDASITETLRELRQHRRAQGRSWGRVVIALIMLAAIGLPALVVIVVPTCESCEESRPAETTYATVMWIKGAAQLYVARSGGCPTVEDLIDRGVINADYPATDAWDQPLRIDCGASRVYVSSAGPDGQLGTCDDITSWRRPR